jgi:hypothetical protein
LHELAPGVAEYERLQAAYAALEGSGADPGDGRRRVPALALRAACLAPDLLCRNDARQP